MCASVSPPPYMLGERPSSVRGIIVPSFHQVPYIRVSERVDSGLKIRKQMRKYLKALSSTQHMVAQMHLQDACITTMQPQEIAQSCFESFFSQMKSYNQIVGQKHLEASKAIQEMTKPLENSNKSKKWARDVYNQVQKCVIDVQLAEKKMDKVRLRQERSHEELAHWKKVLEANEETYQVQPNNPEVIRAYQSAQTRFTNAFAEVEAASIDFQESKAVLYTSLERRDQVVEEATELSQSIEEDRLDTLVIVMKQFVETKKAILQAEIEALTNLQQILNEMDREPVIQQFINDAMAPDMTHRHNKAMYLIEWHRQWHLEQQLNDSLQPSNVLAITKVDDVTRLKQSGLSMNDVEVIKDFVLYCFHHPDQSILSSTDDTIVKHRSRFTDTKSATIAMYRLSIVRCVLIATLHHQRAHSLELTREGITLLSSSLMLVLDASMECDDAKTIKSIMNLSQTFYCVSSNKKEYLLSRLVDHPIWSIPQYWGNALLLSIGGELSKSISEQPWYLLSETERAQVVLQVHNIVYGQVTSFLVNLQSFGYSSRQQQEFIENVCFSYELAEDQRIALLKSIKREGKELTCGRCTHEGGDIVRFTSSTLPDWTYLCQGMQSTEKFQPFQTKNRSISTLSTTMSMSNVLESSMSQYGVGGVDLGNLGSGNRINTGSISGSSITGSVSSSTVMDLEELKQRASSVILANNVGRGNVPPPDSESWEDLFGDGTASEDGKRSKSGRRSSRKSADPLRIEKNPTSVPRHRTSPGGNAHNVKRQSVDDSALLLSEESAQRKERRRQSKARSAAAIDTTSTTIQSNIPLASTAAKPGGTLDESIKARADQMRKRRAHMTTGTETTQRTDTTTSENHVELSGVAALRARFENK